ncbi:MAG TPA: type II secretion system F family protein [Bryobacteraceae bacterium]|nr:type II secretion system F family protein [Bryobacteraceae bacterium]
MALTAILVFLATFLAAALAVLIGWFAIQRMGAEALAEDVSEHLLDESPRVLKDESLSSISPWANLLQRWDFIKIMRRHLQQADLSWSVGRFTMLMLLAASVALAIAMREDRIPGIVAVVIALLVGSLPYLYILRRRAKRFRRFEENFPDALDSLARALRAGHPFAAGMDIVSQECEAPVSTELRKAAAEANLGSSWEQALANLSDRIPLLEVSMFAAAIQMQTRTGGKLNEVLAKLAENMREATSLRGEVRALAAHGKMTGGVLTVLPLVIAGMMMIVNPSYLTILVYHPYGKYLIAGAIVCLVLAHIVIRKIVDIKI